MRIADLLLVFLLLVLVNGQSFCNFPLPKSYIAYLLEDQRIVIDGKLDDPAWQEVEWTDPFQDIQGPTLPRPRFFTAAKMRWDSEYLYVGAYLQEPQIWANLTEHNSVIFYDNDFEVFVDPNWSNTFYKEFEMNALNTTWDLYLNYPYLDGGSPTNNWDISPILSAVYIDGHINSPQYTSNYWSVEIAFPFKSLGYLQQNLTVPPKPKDQWRINFSRVEYYVKVVNGRFVKVPNVPEDNWVWSSQDVINMHLPEKWGFVQFSSDPVNHTTFQPDPHWTLRSILLQVYYAEREFRSVTGYYTPDIQKLKLSDFILAGKCVGIPAITPNDSTLSTYEVRIDDNKGTTGYINYFRQMWLEPTRPSSHVKITV